MNSRRTEPGTASPAGAAPVHHVVRNSTLNLTGFGLNAAFNLMALFVLARRLGVEMFGQYYTLYAMLFLVQLVSEAGISTVLTCRLALNPRQWQKTVAEASGLLGLVVLVSFFGFLAIGWAWAGWRHHPEVLVLFAWLAVACAGMHVQRFCSGVFQGFELFQYDAIAKVIQSALFGVLVTGVVVPGAAALKTALAMLAVSNLAAAVFLVVSLQWRRRCWTVHCNFSLLKDWLAEAGPLGLADVLRRLAWQVDTLLLGLLQPAVVVGLYSVACRPLATLNWVPFVILTATLPSFARMAEQNRRALDRAFATSLRLLWITSIPIAVSISVCAEAVIILLAGREYLEAALPMRLLIWITNLLFLSVPFRFLFAALGKPRIYLVLVTLVLAVEAGVEAALIPRWSYFGACTGGLLGESLYLIVGLIICRRLGFQALEWAALARAGVAGGIMAALLWFARGVPLPMLLPVVALAVGFYFLLCIWLGALHAEEVGHFVHAMAGFLPRASGPAGSTSEATAFHSVKYAPVTNGSEKPLVQ